MARAKSDALKKMVGAVVTMNVALEVARSIGVKAAIRVALASIVTAAVEKGGAMTGTTPATTAAMNFLAEAQTLLLLVATSVSAAIVLRMNAMSAGGRTPALATCTAVVARGRGATMVTGVAVVMLTGATTGALVAVVRGEMIAAAGVNLAVAATMNSITVLTGAATARSTVSKYGSEPTAAALRKEGTDVGTSMAVALLRKVAALFALSNHGEGAAMQGRALGPSRRLQRMPKRTFQILHVV